METIQIRQAKMEDFPQILALYDHARAFMAEHGNPTQWGKNYPSEELVQGDIQNGNQYVGVADGKIVATFFYCAMEDPDYQVIDGAWLNGESYGVVHRITSDGTIKGAASACLGWAFEQCGNLKIDTHRDNVVMQNMLKKNGFQYCGIIHIRDGAERLAYQKTDKRQGIDAHSAECVK